MPPAACVRHVMRGSRASHVPAPPPDSLSSVAPVQPPSVESTWKSASLSMPSVHCVKRTPVQSCVTKLE